MGCSRKPARESGDFEALFQVTKCEKGFRFRSILADGDVALFPNSGINTLLSGTM
jgi:hypothetical protein